MPYDPKIHHRRSIRLKSFDYTHPGAYFVTIVVQGRKYLLGEISRGEKHLSQAGTIVQQSWFDLPNHYVDVELDEFCIMPNHVHGIIVLLDSRGGSDSGRGGSKDPPLQQMRPYLPEIVRNFKSFSARRINVLRGTPGIPFWQRNYYEHIIRSEAEWERTRAYIKENPGGWAEDKENLDK